MKDNIIITKYSGFFLIELLVALGIFAMVSLFTFQFQANISEQKHEIKKYIEALNLISSFIDEISIYGFKDKKNQIGEFTIQIEDEFTDNVNQISNKKIFILKKIIISWKSLKGKYRSISTICGLIL